MKTHRKSCYFCIRKYKVLIYEIKFPQQGKLKIWKRQNMSSLASWPTLGIFIIQFPQYEKRQPAVRVIQTQTNARSLSHSHTRTNSFTPLTHFLPNPKKCHFGLVWLFGLLSMLLRHYHMDYHRSIMEKWTRILSVWSLSIINNFAIF